MKVLDKSTQDILKYFQDAYYNQIHKQMNLASEEHILSSIFSYVLSTFTGDVNKAYNDRFLSTATGEALDRIAEQYNLTRNGLTIPIYTAFFDITEGARYKLIKWHIKSGVESIPAGSVKAIINGVTYENYNSFVTESEARDYMQLGGVRFVTHENPSNIVPMSREDLIKYAHDHESDPDWPFEPLTEDLIATGLENISPIYYADDADFREYINANMKTFKPGTAEAFECLTELISPYILSARCRRQNEPNYKPGMADIYLKMSDYDRSGGIAGSLTYHNFVLSVFHNTIVETMQHYGTLSLGQTLEMHLALPIIHTSSEVNPQINMSIYVPKKFKGLSTIYDNNNWKYKILYTLRYMNKHDWNVGVPFNFDRFVNLLEQPLESFTTIEEVDATPAVDANTNYWESCKRLTCTVYRSDYDNDYAAPGGYLYAGYSRYLDINYSRVKDCFNAPAIKYID